LRNHILRHKYRFICLLILIIIAIIIPVVLLLIYFLLNCEIGDRDKCLTSKKLTKSCASCNDGYELYKGKYITYQIMVKYFSIGGLEKIIIYYDYERYFSFIKIKFNGEENYDFCFDSLKFQKWGEHTIYFYFDKEKIDSFSYMFSNMEFSFNPKCFLAG